MKEYIETISISHRKKFGQFFTPLPVARLMAQWILENNPKSILDPAFGLGVFYEAVLNEAQTQDIQFTAYDIDENIISYFKKEKNIDIDIKKLDYLETKLGNFDSIICNPPYMRFQNFTKREKTLPFIEAQVGIKLEGYSNISSIFLIKALNDLNENGNLAFIMPFEFFNAGYGKEIKKILIEKNLLKQIIILSNEKEIFPDATTTISILLCKKDNIKNNIKITNIDCLDSINKIIKNNNISNFFHAEIKSEDLPYHEKWTPIISSLFSNFIIPDNLIKISYYGGFKRGIATGANDFFALNKTKINEWNLSNNYIECITKSAQIKDLIFTKKSFDLLSNSDKSVYCLNVKNKEADNYINHGESLNYHERYLTKNRSPWYKLESRIPAHILCGVFNRGRIKFIRNYTSAINFTCFHSFYANEIGKEFIDKLFIYFISDIGQSIIKNNKRSYGNNLDKFEPGDLNQSLCPDPNQLNKITDIQVEQVLHTALHDEVLAIQLSNSLIEKILNTQS